MLLESELRSRLRKLSPASIYGPFSRFVAFKHLVSSRKGQSTAEPRPLWGIGSVEGGGRFNPPHKFEVIYLAEDPVTALKEVEMVFAPSAGQVVRVQHIPIVHVSILGILLRAADLTDETNQSLLGTTEQELTGEWRFTQAEGREAPTQLLGRAIFQQGDFDAIRYPSSKNRGGICVAVFPERLSQSSIYVYDPDGNLAQQIPAPLKSLEGGKPARRLRSR
jgi:RES domain-containing protein